MKKFLSLLVLLNYLIPARAQNGQYHSHSDDSLRLKIMKQPRFFVNVHKGYSIGLGSTFSFYPDDISSVQVQQNSNGEQNTNIQYKQQKKGLGDGFRIGVGLSYIVNDFINVGIDFDYFNSTISKTRDSSFTRLNAAGKVDYSYKESYKISYDATLLTFTPNITFKAISRPKFYIYNKVGAVLVLRPNSIQNETQIANFQTNSQGTVTDSSAYNIKRYDWGLKNPAYGFMGGIGGQFRLSEKIRGFIEVDFTHVVFMVKNRILTNYVVDGKELINSLPVSSREVVFQSSYEVTNSTNTNPNQPTVAVYERFPVTYAGVQAGVALRF